MGTRRSISRNVGLPFLCVSLAVVYFAVLGTQANRAAQGPALAGAIEVNVSQVAGTVPRYLFGQFIEHEHNTIDDGLLAELLRDRKFDEGDLDGNGVSSEWVPEERVQDRYWELRNGRGVNDRYSIDPSHLLRRRGFPSHRAHWLGLRSRQRLPSRATVCQGSKLCLLRVLEETRDRKGFR